MAINRPTRERLEVTKEAREEARRILRIRQLKKNQQCKEWKEAHK